MSKFRFAVLVVSGTICMLASLGAIAFLYHFHADRFASPNGAGSVDTITFVTFAGLPSLVVFIAGAVLVAMGVKIGRREDGE
jgi:hypothetical protein